MDKKINLTGNKIASYQIDYLGGHANIEAVLMNASFDIFEEGIMISTSLQKGFIYLKWEEIESLAYYKELPEKIEIYYEEEKTIVVEKADEGLNIPDMLLKIKSASPDTEILQNAKIHNHKEDHEEALFEIDEQDLRVLRFFRWKR